MSLENLCHKNEAYLYELRETEIPGLFVAENYEEHIGFVEKPQDYEYLGMDDQFRKTYRLKGLNS